MVRDPRTDKCLVLAVIIAVLSVPGVDGHSGAAEPDPNPGKAYVETAHILPDIAPR